MARIDPSVQALLQRYDVEVRQLLRRGYQTTEKDLARIRREFQSFARDVLMRAQAESGYQRLLATQLVRRLADDIDALERKLVGILHDGGASQADLARELLERYAFTFLPEGSQIANLGVAPGTFDMVMGYSADLIRLRTGGLASDVLGRINREIRLAALGGTTPEKAIIGVSRALELGGKWSYQAERIYRTETLRLHSMTTETGIAQLNARRPTGKRWRWSHIERVEHAAANGQLADAHGFFRIQVPGKGYVRMRYPRDHSAPASATVNCGCHVDPVPIAA